MFVVLDQEAYQPGEQIEGLLFFEVFMPCFQNKLMIKFESVETFPKRFTEELFEKEGQLLKSSATTEVTKERRQLIKLEEQIIKKIK
jgi:hypothetical protein